MTATAYQGSADIEWTGTAVLSNAAADAALQVAVNADATAQSVAALQSSLNGLATASAVTTLQTSVTANGTSLTAIQTTLSGLVASILNAIKTDSLLAKTWNTVLKKFTYVPGTGVMTCLQDDGATPVGSNTITQVSGTITSRV